MTIRRILLAGAAVVCWLSVAGSAQAQQQIFLEIGPGFEGESTTPGFLNQVNVLNASFAAANPACTGGKGAISVSEIIFTKYVDTASVDMYNALQGHQVFPTVNFRFVRSNVVYQQFQLTNAVFSSVNGAGTDGDVRNVESWTVSFSQAVVTYRFVDSNGKAGAPESMTITPATCPGS